MSLFVGILCVVIIAGVCLGALLYIRRKPDTPAEIPEEEKVDEWTAELMADMVRHNTEEQLGFIFRYQVETHQCQLLDQSGNIISECVFEDVETGDYLGDWGYTVEYELEQSEYPYHVQHWGVDIGAFEIASESEFGLRCRESEVDMMFRICVCIARENQ